jgi:hypothetical protein
VNNNLQSAIEQYMGFMRGDAQNVTLSRSKAGVSTWKVRFSAIRSETDKLLKKLLAVDHIFMNYFYGQKLAVNDVQLSDPSITEEPTITIEIERGAKGGCSFSVSTSGKSNEEFALADEVKTISDKINSMFDSLDGQTIKNKGVMIV